MSLQPVLRYSLDLSGSDPDNKVVGEVHTLTPVAPNRSIAPYYGSFYTADLKVRDVGGTIDAIAYENIDLTGTAPLVIGSVDLGDNEVGFKRVRLANQTNVMQNGFYQYVVSGGNYTLTPMALGAILTPGIDYVPTMLHQDATRVSGKEVCQLIVITNQTLLGDVVLEYQAVGGDYSISSDALEQLIETLNLDERPVVWGEIIGLPNTFPPVDHLHHIQDFKGFGHLIDALDDIRNLIAGGINVGIGGGDGTGSRIWVGVSPPVSPLDYPLWYNTQDLTLNLYYENTPGNFIWLEIANASGTQGPQGDPGPQGPQGDPGPQGTPGTNGVDTDPTKFLTIPCGSQSTPTVAANRVFACRVPFKFSVTDVKASLKTAQTSGALFTIVIKRNGVVFLDTPITFDNTETTTRTATTPPVLPANVVFQEDDEISFDITQVGDGSAIGPVVTLLGLKIP